MTSSTSRCKKGTRRIPPKTGKCIPKNTVKKRCANGTHKNRKTGNCEPKKTKTKKRIINRHNSSMSSLTLSKRSSSSSSSSANPELSTKEIEDLVDHYLDEINGWMSKSEKEEIRNDKTRIVKNAKRLKLDEDKIMEELDADDMGLLGMKDADIDRYLNKNKNPNKNRNKTGLSTKRIHAVINKYAKEMDDEEDSEFFSKAEIKQMTKNAKKFNLTEAEIYDAIPDFNHDTGKLAWVD